MAFPTWVLDEVIRNRPAIRVTQLGYLPGTQIRATMISDRVDPIAFALVDAHGGAVAAGASQPWPARPDPSSGMNLHVIEAAPQHPVDGPVRFIAAGIESHPFRVTGDLYEALAAEASRVFKLMRSGSAVTERDRAGYARPAGHLDHLPNRGDTAVSAWTGPDAERLYPSWRCQGTFDVSGGWYDAGDYGKYVTSGALACWSLLGVLDVIAAEGPRNRALADAVREECRWQLDWMLRMQVPSGDPLAGMAFHRVHGTRWSPIPGLPHEDPTLRVLHRPSTPATFHLAAVAAHGAHRFRDADPEYADRLLGAARTAYDAGMRHPDLAAPDDGARYGGGPYGDDDATDDHYWAAAELWIATREERFREAVRRSPWHTAAVFDPSGFDFDRVAGPARLDLALHGAASADRSRVRDSVVAAADELVVLAAAQPFAQPYAPHEGWGWGSNGRILNNLVVLVVAHRITGEGRYRHAAATGMDYLLGRNALGQSYVTGYGADHSRHQRTRQFGHDLDPALPPPPPGALAGGANSVPHPDFPYDERLRGLPPQCCYVDEPTSEVTNDICIRWNAPLAYVTAFLARSAPLP